MFAPNTKELQFTKLGIACALLTLAAAAPIHSQWITPLGPGTPRISDGKVNLSAPVPKLAGGKPDLSGVWATEPDFFRDLTSGMKPEDVPILPWAKALQEKRDADNHQDDPMALCMPPGVPRINTSAGGFALHPFKIVQTPALIVLLYETSVNSTFRQVFMDGRALPRDAQPTWLGYSVGRWDRNTLVVETTGFNGRAWLDTAKGHPQTEEAHVTERFTRRDFGHLDLEVTIDDPKAYSKPWRALMHATLLPEIELIETFCENEKDRNHQGAQ